MASNWKSGDLIFPIVIGFILGFFTNEAFSMSELADKTADEKAVQPRGIDCGCDKK